MSRVKDHCVVSVAIPSVPPPAWCMPMSHYPLPSHHPPRCGHCLSLSTTPDKWQNDPRIKQELLVPLSGLLGGMDCWEAGDKLHGNTADFTHWGRDKMARQNGRHFPDGIFKCIFLNENIWISLKIWLKFVPKVRINKIPVLVQIMAWRRPGNKPLSEPTMV